MKKVIRLTENDITRLVKRVINEQTTQNNLTTDELAVLGLCAMALFAKTDVKNSTMDDLMSGMERNKKIGKLAQDLFNKKQSGTGTYDKNIFQVMLNVLKEMYPNQSDVDELIKRGTNLKNLSTT